VAPDLRHNALTEEPRPEMYFPHGQLPRALGGTTAAMSVVVRTTQPPAAMTQAVRGAVAELDPALPLSNVRTLDDVVADAWAGSRFTASLLALFAALALTLGGIGVYGVIAYGVSRRRREIGIRVALGAETGRILALVVRRALLLVGAGVVLGLAAALGLTRLIAGLLHGVTATDPVTFAAVPLILALVAVAASWLPARRAARVDPVAVLREE
jgi:putative ABC transport system permease protein